MEKKEIIDYLSACIDAEQGVYETNRLVNELNEKIYEIEQKDYKDGKLIPEPKLEAVAFHESKPTLNLEHDEKLDDDVQNLKKSVSSYSKAACKRRILNRRLNIICTTALCVFVLWYIASDSVINALDRAPDRVGIIYAIAILVLFVIGVIIFFKEFGAFILHDVVVILFLVIPFLSFIAAYIASSRYEASDKTVCCLLFYPEIIYALIVFICNQMSHIFDEEKTIKEKEAQLSELSQLETQQASMAERNEVSTQNYNKKVAEYERRKEQVLECKVKNNNEKTEQYKMTVRNAIAVDSLTRKTLIAEREKQEEMHAEFVNRKDELYAKNYVHERFRNIAALMQIREYLEMGVADTLEGAYTEYLKDIRADKIVGSIDSLRRTIEKGITVLAYGQATLYKELITANMNLNNLSYELSSNLKMIDNSIFDMKFDLEEAIRDEGYRNRDAFSNSINSVISYSNMINESNRDAYSSQLQQIVDSQRSLLDTVEKSSYNQYLVAKKENVDNYIYSSLRDPR